MLVAGRPAQLLATVMSEFCAPTQPVFALARPDLNAAIAEVARRLRVGVAAVQGVAVWGSADAPVVDLRAASCAGRGKVTIDAATFMRHF